MLTSVSMCLCVNIIPRPNPEFKAGRAYKETSNLDRSGEDNHLNTRNGDSKKAAVVFCVLYCYRRD